MNINTEKIPNIAILCTGLNGLGGTTNHLAAWLSHLNKKNIKIYLIYQSTCKENINDFFKERLSKDNYTNVIFVPRERLFFPLITITRLVFLLKQLKINLVHTVFLQSDLIGVLSAKLAGIGACISSIEGRLIPSVSWIKRLLYIIGNKIIRSWIDETIVISKGLFRQLEENGEIIIPRTTVIYSGIETSIRFKPKNIGNEICIGAISRLSHEKGIIYFVRAIPEIASLFPNARFTIAGDGNEKNTITREAKLLGISEKITFQGWVTDISKALQCIDIVVVPSLEEGLPRLVIESLWHMKPVVATSVGGIPELVIPNQTGILVPPANHEAIAKAVCRLISFKKLIYLYGLNGNKLIENKFNIKNEIDEIERIYIKTIGEKN